MSWHPVGFNVKEFPIGSNHYGLRELRKESREFRLLRARSRPLRNEMVFGRHSVEPDDLLLRLRRRRVRVTVVSIADQRRNQHETNCVNGFHDDLAFGLGIVLPRAAFESITGTSETNFCPHRCFVRRRVCGWQAVYSGRIEGSVRPSGRQCRAGNSPASYRVL